MLSQVALPKKSTACRLMHGIPLAFRQSAIYFFGLCPVCRGRSPEFLESLNGSAERFRTSGGVAEANEALFRQSRVKYVIAVKTVS